MTTQGVKNRNMQLNVIASDQQDQSRIKGGNCYLTDLNV